MSLMQLLTVGKCFSDPKNRPHHYKLSSKRLLPKFGQEPIETQKPSQTMITQTIDNKNDVSNTRQSGLGSAVSPTPPSASTARRFPHGRWTPEPATRAVFDETPFAQERGQPPAESPLSLPAEPSKSQKELALETITPLRNDLTESDLEFVLSAENPQSNPFSGPNEAAGQNPSPAPVWSRIAARLFGT